MQKSPPPSTARLALAALLAMHVFGCGAEAADHAIPPKKKGFDTTRTQGKIKTVAKDASNGAVKAPLPQTCDYAVHALLDQTEYRCRGNAAMNLSLDAGKANCVAWRLDSLQCQGDPTADWLHDSTRKASLCKENGEWVPRPDLPGNSFCSVTGLSFLPSGLIDTLGLWCEWKCRSGSNPCSGNATYSFHCRRH